MSDYNLRLLISSISIPLILFLCLSASALGKQHVSAKTTTDWGVRSTTVNTPSGKLTVNMPDDTALGDTISGTVIAEPAGETVEERQANMDTLDGYVFDIPEIPSKTVVSEPKETPRKEPESKKVVTWEIPATVSAEIVALVLRDPKGDEVIKTDFPVSPSPSYTPPAEPAASDYNLPHIGQAGRPVEVTGPFDGEVVNTDVKIGGRDTRILAQSPRKTVVESPRDVIGPTDIELTEGNVTVKDQYRNIALRLSADKLRLKRGEQTTLTVQVMGLQGLQEEIPFNLENKSPAVVSMEGGEVQTVTVRPEEIGSEGVYTISRTLTGIQTGPFSISSRISPEYMTVPLLTMAGDEKKDKEVKECDCKRLKVELDGKSKTRRYQEKLKDGKTRILLEVPYRYKTECTKGDPTAKCGAEIKVEAERKSWKGPEPESEEVHNGREKDKKVTFFKKPLKGDKNIDCSRKCPDRPGMSKEWTSSTLYYEAIFKKLDKVIEDKVRITLTPEKCERGGTESKSYDIYSCECNKITLVFPGIKKGKRGVYYLDVNKGRIQRSITNEGVRLNIPYLYSIKCTGHGYAKCNAEVQVDGKPIKWEVENAEKRGTGFIVKGVELDKIVINKPKSIACTGKCSRKGKTTRSNPRESRMLGINISTTLKKKKTYVPERSADRHEGEFELTFTPRYCDELEVKDKIGKDGEVVKKITVRVDIKSDKWRELVKDD